MQPSFFSDKSIIRQEVVAVVQKKKPKNTEGVSLLVVTRIAQVGSAIEIVLTREELRAALKYIDGED